MTLVRWDPFREIAGLSDRLNRMLSDDPFRLGREEFLGSWAPPVDIYEKDDHLVIRAELPGVPKEDVDIRIENGVLTVRGERKREEKVEEARSYRMERVHGYFSRSFSLPTSVDASRISATFKDGILQVSIPKAEEAKPRRVEIQAA